MAGEAAGRALPAYAVVPPRPRHDGELLLDPESECEALLPVGEDAPRELRPFWPLAMRQACTVPIFAVLCLTGVTLAWLHRGSHGTLAGDAVPAQLLPEVKEEEATHAAMQVGASDGCGPVDNDMDYWTERPLYNKLVTSAGLCRARCTWEARCGAWTWGKQRGVQGLSDVCFLKILDKGQWLHKKRRDGVVSGLPCRVSWGDGPAVATQTTTVFPQVSAQWVGAAVETAAPTTTLRSPVGAAAGAAGGGSALGDGPSVFCFALMLPGSYEQGLLSMQYRERVSMFACNEYAVYSNATIRITAGLNTSVVNSSLHCERGGEFGTALNTGIFMAVWAVVARDGHYLHHDWTVKVDPDAVFFPSRLRTVLSSYWDIPQGVYLNNCKFGLHGPLEVFSRTAVAAWTKGVQRCQEHFDRLCSGPCLWGEDMFIDQCLSRVLGVRRENEWQLLIEDHCDPPDGWQSCRDPTHVAFHPFKTVIGYHECLRNGIS